MHSTVLASEELAVRVRRGVELFDQRGYALPAAALGRLLPGGAASVESVIRAARGAGLVVDGDVIQLPERNGLAAESRRRMREHARLAPYYESVAVDYARSLARHCPWVRSVLISGSLASGGFTEEDDVDISLVVEDGTKYVSYLFALLLALPVAWRHRRKSGEPTTPTPLLRKVVCINVVWTESQTKPFSRADDAMAVELLLSRPIMGGARWREIILRNARLVEAFPQLAEVPAVEHATGGASGCSRLLALSTSGPLRGLFEEPAFVATRALHAFVRWWRRKNPAAIIHVDHREHTKHPYAILDRPEVSR